MIASEHSINAKLLYGLLLFGNVGTGKTYAAGCIANALIDRMISVLYVGMSNVVNRMQGNFGADRDSYIKQLMRPDLLILDDLARREIQATARSAFSM